MDAAPSELRVDPRHQKRIDHMQALFSFSFYEDKGEKPTDSDEIAAIQAVIEDLPAIDKQIAKFAPERPLKDINKVDLSILRLIVHESKTADTPVKVLVDEAVELAKEFGSETSPKFINGVLGQLFGISLEEENHE